MRFREYFFALTLALGGGTAFAQSDAGALRIFGYFQNEFTYEKNNSGNEELTSFNLQQLNVFMQKDFSEKWSSHVNFELINTFSTFREWGDLNLEEAWVRYRASHTFNLKLGLHIPEFNHLNAIKNKTPLLPYVVRPFVYETSFNEFFNLEKFLPERAFMQASGFLQFGEAKLDYAFSLGNSPNISNKTSALTAANRAQTGTDTSTTFLGVGRIGVRYRNLEAGVSASHDRVNFFEGLRNLVPATRYSEIPRIRVGADLAYRSGGLVIEGETLNVRFDEEFADVNTSSDFDYLSVGYRMSEKLFVYGSYWAGNENDAFIFFKDPETQSLYEDGKISLGGLDEDNFRVEGVTKTDIKIPTLGLSYNLTDQIILKGQFARARIQFSQPGLRVNMDGFNEINNEARRESPANIFFLATAVSVFF